MPELSLRWSREEEGTDGLLNEKGLEKQPQAPALFLHARTHTHKPAGCGRVYPLTLAPTGQNGEGQGLQGVVLQAAGSNLPPPPSLQRVSRSPIGARTSKALKNRGAN